MIGNSARAMGARWGNATGFLGIAAVLMAACLLAGFQCEIQAAVGPPGIRSFTPDRGAPGTSVTLTGFNFVRVREVRFHTAPALFTTVSSEQIAATVPLDAESGPISVMTASGSVVTLSHFFVAPRITEFIPASGAPGTSVKISGANFTGTSSVQFSGRPAAFSVVGASQIQATVPAGATSGPVRVTTPVGIATSGMKFFVTKGEPVVEVFAPTNGPPGTVVTIDGQDFLGANAVRFSTVPAPFTVVSRTQIRATLPAGATNGPIRISNPAGTGVSTQIFLVHVAPLIKSFSPQIGTSGTTVILEGSQFANATSVRFNGTNAAFSVVSPTQIHATVPANATSGPITVTTPLGTGASSTPFFVTFSPLIAEFAPTNGPVGTAVTVNGVNFTGATAVRFGTNAANFSVVAPTQIRAIVPSGAVSAPITVANSRGTNTTADFFWVLRSGPLLTGFTPTAGQPGTRVVLHGFNFSGASAVKFNGSNALFSVTAPTQIHTEVPAGATTGPISVTTTSGTHTNSTPFIVAPRIQRFSPESGPAGTQVQIEGMNFSQVQSVRIGGVPQSFTRLSERQISAVVSQDAVTGSISVTTPAGIVASTNVFRVLPQILSFSPPDGPVGTRVRILGTHLGNAQEVRFGQTRAAFTVISNQEIEATVPFGAVTGPIAVQTLNGTAASAQPFVVGVVPPRISFELLSDRRLQLAWPSHQTNFFLQQVGRLQPPLVWTDVNVTPVKTGDALTVTVPLTNTNRFFRLIRR